MLSFLRAPASLLLLPLLLGAALLPLSLRADDAPVKSLIPERSLDEVRSGVQFWASGANTLGEPTGRQGGGPVVDSKGKLTFKMFPPAVRFADIDGDGLLDLVMSDAQGGLWIYYNRGTKTDAKFDAGIPIPIDLGGSPLAFDITPPDAGGLRTFFFGNGLGELFRVRMMENSAIPRFEATQNLDAVAIPTSAKGLWCAYLAPALAQWIPGSENADLLVGDGTYAADNIYYLKNTGSNARPQFAERVLLLRGEGREQLSVCSYDWNGDKKPDLFVGDREGHLLLYLNDTAEGATQPKFKEPIFLKLNGKETGWGSLVRATIGDLDGNGKPVILFSSASDSDVTRTNPVRIARNTGTVAEPKFDKVDAVKIAPPGVATMEPVRWNWLRYYGIPSVPPASSFFVLQSVSAEPAEAAMYEKDFEMPAGTKSKHALKFSFVPQPKGTVSDAYIFEEQAREKNREIPIFELNLYTWKICYIPNGTGFGGSDTDYLMLTPDTNYELHFWAKGDRFDKGHRRGRHQAP